MGTEGCAEGRPDAGLERRLERLYGEYVDRLIADANLDAEAIIAEHPDVGPELVERLRAFLAIGEEEFELATLGDYRLLRQIGRGGMGVVYEAWQGSMDRKVALKVLPAGVAAENKSFLRFMREARTAGKLNHSNVVSVYGMGVEASTPYYSMELVDGETLAQLLARVRTPEGKASLEEQERLMAQVLPRLGGRGLPSSEVNLQYCLDLARSFAGVADGLQHAHEKGIVHRDIKPSNLILDAQGRLRILDFGLARLEGQESITVSGDFIGTPLYMSPEQARVRKAAVDHRTDIYSLGATLYQMLVWQPPIRGRDHPDTLSRILHVDPRPPRSINPRIPQDLENIVLKCLRKEASDRYATAEALAQDLRRFVRGDPVEARPQPAWEKLQRRLTRHSGTLLGSLGGVLLLVTSGLLLRHHLVERSAGDERRYGEQVTEAVMMLELGELTVKAGSERSLTIDPQDLFMTGDFRTFAEESGLHPLAIAAEKLEEAKRIVPSRAEAYYHLARAKALLGEEEKAIEELDRALRQDGAFVPARVLRDDLLRRRTGEAAERQGPNGEGRDEGREEGNDGWRGTWLAAHGAMESREWKEAATLWSRQLEEARRSGEPYIGASAESCLGRGRALLEDGDLTSAIESFVAARTLWPDARVPQLLLGKAYYLKGEKADGDRVFVALHAASGDLQDETALWVGAIYKYFREYQRGLEWSAKLKQERLRLRLEADFYNLLGRFDDAIRVGREAIARFPDDARSHHCLAVALINERKTSAEGLEIAKRAVELDPGRADTLSLLATAYQCCEEPAKAEELFNKAVAMTPDAPRGHDHLGRLLQTLGRLGEAEACFRRAIRLVETRSSYHFLSPHNNLGCVLIAQGKLEDAVFAFRRAVEFDSRNPLPRGNMGIALKRLGRLEEAARSLEATIRLRPRDPRVRRQLALIHLAKGRAAAAISGLREAVEIDPAFAPAVKDLAVALEESGKPLEAFDTYLSAFLGDAPEWAIEGLVSLERRAGGDGVFAARWDEVAGRLEGCRSNADRNPVVTHGLAVAFERGATRRDLGAARELAREAVEATRRERPDYLATLAGLESLGGSPEKALSLLEETVRSPGAVRIHQDLLEEHRRLHPSEQVDGAATGDRGDPGLVLRIAASLRERGNAEAALTGLQRTLETRFGDDRDVWDLWAALGLGDLARSPSTILAGWPPPGGPGRGGTHESDLRWLLERLSAHEPLRINCGGGEVRTAAGLLWAADRFYQGGRLRPVASWEISGTDDDALYRDARWFPDEEIHRGYRIPLPRGRYRVTLHLAEISLLDTGPRSMDVLIEGKEALEGYDVFSAGFASASRHAFEVLVEDGSLDIEVRPHREDGMLSALEVEPLPE